MPAKARPCILGLSGGSDSLALAARLRGQDVVAVVVDHGLRGESAQDARRAADQAEALGLRAVVRRWEGDKPASGLQAAARRARLSLLAEEARRIGAERILLAHTRDDQAETVLWRLARGSDLPGLAAMRALSPHPIWPQGRGLLIERPVLGETRSALRAELSAAGLAWIEDPANSDRRFARARVRARLAAAPAASEALVRIAAHAGRLRAALEEDACALLAAGEWAGDRMTLPLADGPSPGRALLVAALCASLGGAARAAPLDRAEGLLARLDRAGGAATLSGALVRRRSASLTFARAPTRKGALDGQPADSRWRLAAFLHDLPSWTVTATHP